jgi:hypothetical protein
LKVGKRLQTYVLWLCEKAANEEIDLNMNVAFTLYMEALFIIKEMSRELNNTLKFSTE